MVSKFNVKVPTIQAETGWARGLDTGIIYRRTGIAWLVIATPRPFPYLKEGDIVSSSYVQCGRGIEHLPIGTIITLEL